MLKTKKEIDKEIDIIQNQTKYTDIAYLDRLQELLEQEYVDEQEYHLDNDDWNKCLKSCIKIVQKVKEEIGK